MNETVNEQFSGFFTGKLSPEDFREWVTQTPELKEVVREDDYQRLITTDFKQADARHSIEEVIRRYVDWGQFEKEKLAETLMDIVWNENPVAALLDCYERFSNGQRFLQTLGLKYGRLFASAGPPAKTRRLLNNQPDDQAALLSKVWPEAAAEAKRLLGMLVAERIVFTGTYTVGGCPEYIEQ